MGDRLLIVDDEIPILFAMKDYFEGLGYEVDTAAQLWEAQELIDRKAYAFVLADLRLSASDRAEGLELAAYVRERTPAARVLLLTAYGSPEIESQARQLGVDAFLHKPQPLSRIAGLVRELALGPARSDS
jgi:two-component system response regulator YesN